MARELESLIGSDLVAPTLQSTPPPPQSSPPPRPRSSPVLSEREYPLLFGVGLLLALPTIFKLLLPVFQKLMPSSRDVPFPLSPLPSVTEVRPLLPPFLSSPKIHSPLRSPPDTLEVLPHVLFGALFSGLVYPVAAASLLFCWVVGRVLFTYGYSTGTPSKRYSYGGHLVSSAGDAFSRRW